MAEGDVKVDHMKCAHQHCTCIVRTSDAVMKDGVAYCSEACAGGGHCGHEGCPCGRR